VNGKIIIFCKAPVPGEVKTRLIPALGAQGAATLQATLLHRTLKTAIATEIPCELYCWPNADHPAFAPFRKRYAIPCHDQHGADLGERMANAISRALASADAVLLIGSDCPGIYATYLRAAMITLASGSDAVLGSTVDGGYCLIGLNKPVPGLFSDIPWGSSQVLAMTRNKLAERNMSWNELPPLNDLDTPADLARFPELQCL